MVTISTVSEQVNLDLIIKFIIAHRLGVKNDLLPLLFSTLLVLDFRFVNWLVLSW